jgi:hypothetical protein
MPPPDPEGFSSWFDDEFDVGNQPRNKAYFGRDVLRGLVAGIDDFAHECEPRWRQFRSLGPALLGSAMWIDDPELITKIGGLTAATIVVTKQTRTPGQLRRLEPLRELNERTPGMPIRTFGVLSGLAPKIAGGPMMVGPYDPMDEGSVPTIRTLGFRRLPKTYPPLLHAKLALLGHLWWHDEGALGRVEDVVGFTAKRLWLSSANFTRSSRRSLEFGYWTEEPALVEGAERFLVRLMRSSESLDPDPDSFEPELVPVEYDDDAFAEALSEMEFDDDHD